MKIRSLFVMGLLSSALSAHAIVTTDLSDFTYSPFGVLPANPVDNATNFVTTVSITPPPLVAGGPPSYLGAGGFSAKHGAETFAAYCVEINIFVGIPGSYVDYVKLDAATGFGDRATDLAKLATWANATNFVTGPASSAAMQAAVWEIVHETTAGPYSFGSGKLATASQSAATQSALNAVDWLAIAATTPTVTIARLDSNARQDLLVFAPVPEGSTLTMMMLGLVGVGVVAQRRLDRKA